MDSCSGWNIDETAPGIIFDGLKSQDSWLPVYFSRLLSRCQCPQKVMKSTVL